MIAGANVWGFVFVSTASWYVINVNLSGIPDSEHFFPSVRFVR